MSVASDDSTVVYLVDDDDGVRRSLAAVMASAALPVEAYPSAEAFLAHFEPRLRPGCLVLDLNLPGAGGLDLLRDLRRRGISMSVLVLSGSGSIATALQCMKLGAVDFLKSRRTVASC